MPPWGPPGARALLPLAAQAVSGPGVSVCGGRPRASPRPSEWLLCGCRLQQGPNLPVLCLRALTHSLAVPPPKFLARRDSMSVAERFRRHRPVPGVERDDIKPPLTWRLPGTGDLIFGWSGNRQNRTWERVKWKFPARWPGHSQTHRSFQGPGLGRAPPEL